jgi:hypothetical protein
MKNALVLFFAIVSLTVLSATQMNVVGEVFGYDG